MATTSRVRLGEWISEAWSLMTRQWGVWAGMCTVYFIPLALIYVTGQVVSYKMQPRDFTQFSLNAFVESMSRSLALGFVMQFLMIIVGAFFIGGLYRAAFKQIKGEPFGIADLFSGGDLYVRILVASILIGIIEFVATLFCYFPFFIAHGLLIFTIPLIVRQNAEPLDAMKQSFEAAKQDWLMFAVLAFVTILLAFVGVVACIVGLVFSYPLLILVTSIAYRDYFEPESRSVSRVDELYTKYCKNCGASIPSNANFCDKCGAGQV